MLLFIYILFGTLCTTAPVSIHLMLLFISKHFHIYQIFYKFQYISCYSLSCFSRRSVIFHIPFQYISCYSLSRLLWRISSCWGSFNTSHVTLYHKSYLLALVFLRRFNTSHVTLYRCDRGFHFCTKASFQYISCYSLSSSGVTVTSSSTCFNTSHVTLYLPEPFLQSLG